MSDDALTEEAYIDGRNDAENFHRYEVVAACQAWKEAATDHAHASYYGAQMIRQMRARWLGVLREQRDRNLGW